MAKTQEREKRRNTIFVVFKGIAGTLGGFLHIESPSQSRQELNLACQFMGSAFCIMESCRPKKKKIAVAVGYMFLILITSVIPSGTPTDLWKGIHFPIHIIKNLLHVPMYAILTTLWMQIMRQYDIGVMKSMVLVFFVSSAFGILNELIQLAIPTRYASLSDIGLNTIGIVCGVIAYFVIERRKRGLLRQIVASK